MINIKNKCNCILKYINYYMSDFFSSLIGEKVLKLYGLVNPISIKNLFGNYLYIYVIKFISKRCNLYLSRSDYIISIENSLFNRYRYIYFINPEQKSKIISIYNNSRLQNCVHYIWGTHAENPRQISKKNLHIMRNSINSIRNTNNSTKIILWINQPYSLKEMIFNARESGIKINYFSETKSWQRIYITIEHLIDEFHFGIVSDLMRYAVIYDNGGIYMDLDYFLVNDFSLLLYNDFFVSDKGTATSFIGAQQKEHLFFDVILNIMIDAIDTLDIYLYYPEECYMGCDVAHNLGPYLLQLTYNAYFTVNGQIYSHINEQYLCPKENECMNTEYYSNVFIKNNISVSDFMEWTDYCVGYNYGHHHASGVTWCMH